MKLPKQKEQKFDFKVFYIKRRNSVLFNSIGISFLPCGLYNKTFKYKASTRKRKSNKTRRHTELNKRKKRNIVTVRKEQYKLSTRTKHVNPAEHWQVNYRIPQIRAVSVLIK